MLFSLLIEVAHEIAGLAPATLFERATGLSRMTFKRGRGNAALAGPRRQEILSHRDAWLTSTMRSRGATEEEAAEAVAGIPDGISAQIVHGLGLLGDECSGSIRLLARQLDEADIRMCRLADCDDVPGLVEELGPRSLLGPPYSADLDVSGLQWLREDWQTPDDRRLVRLALTRRAHMALSLLAAIDLEMSRWNRRVYGIDAWNGRARFGALLTEPTLAGRLRIHPEDPIARLVDLVGAVGMSVRQGRWPDAPPSIADMGIQAELSGMASGDGSRFVRSLRSTKHPMTRIAFRALVRSQLATNQTTPREETDAAADLLEPYLVAAHLFSHLMRGLPGHRGHLDRTGWRRAYLGWWQRHAEARPVAVPAGCDGLPRWLLDAGRCD